jgi:uncharacterized membrane protein HdeD (DUF308 family)
MASIHVGGIVALLGGVLMILASIVGRKRNTYANKTADVLVRWHMAGGLDRESAFKRIRMMFLVAICFGILLIIIGIDSLFVDLRQ